MTLPFNVRCDKFTLAFHENGMPKMYRSDLSFIKNGQNVNKGHVLVNHPINCNGFRFYQSSYGLIPEGSKAHLFLLREGKKIQDIKAVKGDSLHLPGKNLLSILRIEENLMNMGPAVKLSITSDQGNAVFWVFQRLNQIKENNPGIEENPMLNPGIIRPYRFDLAGVEEKYYTGLQVSRDPGIPLVAAGAFLMMTGLMMALFFQAKKIWIKIDSDGKFTRIIITCPNNTNLTNFKKETKLLQNLITECLKEK